MKLNTVKKIAEGLDVSERHVRGMIALGLWPVYRIGRKCLRLDPEEIRKITRKDAVNSKR